MSYKKLIKPFAAAILIFVFAGFFPGKSDTYFEISKNIDISARVN